jgi:hypothetical protein
MSAGRKANFHATYRGDQTHIVGEVKGPTTYDQWQAAVDAVYDQATDRTRVGFAPAIASDFPSAASTEER